MAIAVAPVAVASDGRLEINQACVAAGCFVGDTPGFPVETQARQSYVLTSGLAVPDANTTAITLNENSALDLNGFTIQGVTTCSASPTLCTNTGSGYGVNAYGGAQIRNGTILGMGSAGIRGAGLLVENVRIEHSGGIGISGGNGGAAWTIRGCRVQLNGSHGIDLSIGAGGDGAIVERNVIRRIGGDGVSGEDLTVTNNAINANDGYGLNLNFFAADSGYAGNVINDNNGGNGSAQVSGGVQMGSNVCGGDTTCP